MSARNAADICDEITAGLEAEERTQPLAAGWNALTARGDALSTDTRDAKRTTGRARAREKVIDARWDRNNLSFGRAALDASNGKRDQAPYTHFFGTVSASVANAMGIDREVQLGRGVIHLLGTEVGAALRGTWAAAWESTTGALAAASHAKKEAVIAAASQSGRESLYVDDVNRELDRLEGELLRLFPGERDSVDAFLAPTRRAPKKKKNVEG